MGIMTGDFNCWKGSAAMNILRGQLSKSVDGDIDFILTDRGSVISGGKHDGSPSDHPLIKGAFRLSGGSTGGPRRRWTNWAGGSTCVGSNVERRRRASSCVCRRRNGKSSTGKYECVGSSLKFV